MSKEPREFEISRLLELTSRNKYASTVAAFEVIELLEQIDVPRKILNRKPSIQALSLLSEGAVQWDYIEDERRDALEEELRAKRRTISPAEGILSGAGAAPLVDDSDEDLDEAVDTGPGEVLIDDSEEEDDRDDDSDDDDDASTDDDDDDSDEDDASTDDDDDDSDEDDASTDDDDDDTDEDDASTDDDDDDTQDDMIDDDEDIDEPDEDEED